MLKRMHNLLEGLSTGMVLFLSLALLLLVNYVDFSTGTKISLSILYLAPVIIVAWRIRRGAFWFPFCLLAAAIWGIANYEGGASPLIAAWNSFSRLGIFSLTGFLVAEVREMLDHETVLSRTDYLTGAANKRAFEERAELELRRLRRNAKPLSLAYLDVDNFKQVNDVFGHIEGDELLRCLVQLGHATVRQTDLLARMGGDEFALLLPETNSSDAALVMDKLKNGILLQAQRRGWPINLSVGIVTFDSAASSVEEMIHQADALMYSVKGNGKGRIEHKTFAGSPAETAARG